MNRARTVDLPTIDESFLKDKTYTVLMVIELRYMDGVLEQHVVVECEKLNYKVWIRVQEFAGKYL